MVQKGHCPNSFTAAIAAYRRRKRRENCKNLTCFSPWSIISCWFNLEKSKGRKNLDGLFHEEIENEIVIERFHGESSSSAQEVSGEHKKEAYFSLGVGLGLIYLMGTSKNELNKMVELSKEMETLLQNFKRELQNEEKDTDITPSYSTPKAHEVSNYTIENVSVQDCPSSSWEHENSESDITSNNYQNSNCKMNRKGKNLQMDLLQAELEAELEHLQLQLDTEVILNYSNQKYSEIVVEESAPEESQSTSFIEVFEHPEISMMENQGVPPRELERRLHELREVRQQERIRELESALDRAMQKLDENQRELSWWKDTAKVVFCQIPRRCRSMR